MLKSYLYLKHRLVQPLLWILAPCDDVEAVGQVVHGVVDVVGLEPLQLVPGVGKRKGT